MVTRVDFSTIDRGSRIMITTLERIVGFLRPVLILLFWRVGSHLHMIGGNKATKKTSDENVNSDFATTS